MHTTDVFQALADETRLRLFRILSWGQGANQLCVAELADILQKPQYAVSRAIGELRKAGLVQERRDGRLVFYRCTSTPALAELGVWTLSHCDCAEADACQRNPDGSLMPGAAACAYDLERLAWRLGQRGPDGSVRVTWHEQNQRLAAGAQRQRVLFVCVHNSARSQLAQAWLRRLGGDDYLAESAGISPGVLNPYVVHNLASHGIDIAGKPTQAVGELYARGATFDQVITVCDPAVERDCPVFPGPVKRLSWPFPDPSGFTGDPASIQVRVDALSLAIKARIEQFIESETTTRSAS